MPINFKKIQRRVHKIKAETPRLIAVEAVKHFKKSFRDGGFTDDRLSPWAKRKRPNRADKRTRKRRAILVDSGDLRKSIKRQKVTWRTIVVGSRGVSYAKYHNRPHRGMTQRKFIGESHKLNLKTPQKDVLSAWSEYADMFGAPIRIGRTDVQNNVKRENMNNMLGNMGAMAWGTFDLNDVLELVEPNNRDAFKVFQEMAHTVNSELSKLFLGQTGTTDEKSFVGSAEVHERVFNTYSSADKRFVANAINNQLIPLMVLHGIIPDGFEFAFDATERLTLDQKREAVATFAPFFEIDPEWITEQFGTPITAVKAGGFSNPTNGLTNSQRVLVATSKLYESAKK